MNGSAAPGKLSRAGARLERAKIIYISLVIIAAILFGAFVEFKHFYGSGNVANDPCRDMLVTDCVMLRIDSDRYVTESRDFSFSEFVTLIANSPVVGLTATTNIFQLSLFHAVSSVFPGFPMGMTIMINAILYVVYFLTLLKTCRTFGLNDRWFFCLFLLNPLSLFCITSLNKEILGSFLVSMMASAYLRKSVPALVFFTTLSLLSRIAYPVLGALLLIRLLYPRFGVRTVFLILAIILPLIFLGVGNGLVGLPNLLTYSTDLDQQTGPLMNLAAQALAYPFGIILTWAITIPINFLSPILNPAQYAAYAQSLSVERLFTQISAFCFSSFAGGLAIYIAKSRFRLSEGATAYLFLLMIFGIVPISQHRDHLSSWPLLVLAVLDQRRLFKSMANGSGPGFTV